MESPLCCLDGVFLPLDVARIPLDDLGLQRGYGIFDFLRVMGTEPLFLDDHLDRFFRSAERMHLSVPSTRADLARSIHHLAKENALSVSGIRILLTGGPSPDGYTVSKPRLMLVHQPLTPPPDLWPEKGFRLCMHPFLRQMPDVKTTDYLMAIWLQPWLKEQGGDDILYHHEGLVTECPRANFFIVRHDLTVVTPVRDMLHGVTRRQVIRVAQSIGLCVEERDLSRTEVLSAKEAFVSSSTQRIIPVAQIDDRVFDGRAEITHRLWQALLRHEQVWLAAAVR